MVGVLKWGGGELVCCGQPMERLVANTSDASQEKHVPAILEHDGKLVVQIGGALHPATAEHHIEWIYICTVNEGHRYCLDPLQEPIIVPDVKREEIKTIFAYCNIHGLWQLALNDGAEEGCLCDKTI